MTRLRHSGFGETGHRLSPSGLGRAPRTVAREEGAPVSPQALRPRHDVRRRFLLTKQQQAEPRTPHAPRGDGYAPK
jgi:hypothetical protein